MSRRIDVIEVPFKACGRPGCPKCGRIQMEVRRVADGALELGKQLRESYPDDPFVALSVLLSTVAVIHQALPDLRETIERTIRALLVRMYDTREGEAPAEGEQAE